jgi:hypothetical protein
MRYALETTQPPTNAAVERACGLFRSAGLEVC